MTNLTYSTTEHYTEEGYTHYTRDILLDETKIGYIDYMVEVEEDEAYIEYVKIEDEFQNNGYGSQALKAIAKDFWLTYLAPMDEANQRCYERIGEEITGEKYDGVDQGYGVYALNKN